MNHESLPCSHSQAHAAALFEEYRQLYALAMFRLQALDARVPLIGAVLLAALSAAASLPHPFADMLLLGLPLSALWWARASTIHARSFEDILRRIETIEHRVNELLGTTLIEFQSTHPSRGHAVGGRTAQTTVEAALLSTVTLLAGVLWMAHQGHNPALAIATCTAIAIAAGSLLQDARALESYRATQHAPQPN